MNGRGPMTLRILLALASASHCEAVIFLETAAPQYHTSTPGDNSGWQYEGKFSYFLGVPIAPYFFITAKHIGGNVGNLFDFHGDLYTTIGQPHDIPGTDLRIWEVDHAKAFPTFAPLSSGVADLGATATVFGRGTLRGSEVVVSGQSKGWNWGPTSDVQRWGRNTVVDSVTDPDYGELLYCDFDNPGIPGECHLSTGDSGGGMFVLEDGLWRLAAINLSVDGPFRTAPAGTPFNAALYDLGGLEYQSDWDPVTWTPVAEETANIPSAFYGSRIAASLQLILAVTQQDGSLAPENYSAWLRLYFTPAQIATPAATAPLADFDGDGIGNLLEFALNLDPTFNEQAIMPPAAGLRGLPRVRLENTAGNDRLTMEFVRRSATSGAGLTYIPEFSSDLVTWQAVGTATTTAINPRWDRLNIQDPLTTHDTPRRFARLRVTLAE